MMDQATRLRLNAINRDFYAATAGEFDATRGRAWQGWLRLLPVIAEPVESALDIGCGNGRFALFLARRQRQPFVYHGVDSNARLLELARERLAHYPQARAALLQRDLVEQGPPALSTQLTALFGLLHHLPGAWHRRQLISRLAQLLRPGGTLVFTGWRFYEEPRFRRRIVPWGGDLAVERNDFLLDWRRGGRALRYCHYIDDDEHAQLIAASGLSVAADFRADGASGRLNRYTVLRKGGERGNPRSSASLSR